MAHLKVKHFKKHKQSQLTDIELQLLTWKMLEKTLSDFIQIKEDLWKTI